ncbi:MAG: hypothetical protein ACI4V3_05470 [Faecousia sp.]
MAKTHEELLEQAAVIRDETKTNANTAKRVGGALADVVEFLQESPLVKDYTPEIEAASAAANSAALKAEEAKTSADSAYTLARSANTNALSANSTANTAKTTAEAAQTKANEANTKADQLANYNGTVIDPAIEQLAHGGEEKVWDSSSHMNNFVESQNYYIHGERTNPNDGLPILNAASGHTIFGQLSVLDSSLTNGTGAKTDICVTQVLRLSNRTGGDGHIYMRTGQAATKAELTAADSTKWGTWEKLMGVFEKNVVASIKDFDTYTTNGMYSGIISDYNSWYPPGSTFLLITVNGYAVSAMGLTPAITQVILVNAPQDYGNFSKICIRRATWDATNKDWVFGILDILATTSDLTALEARVAALESK